MEQDLYSGPTISLDGGRFHFNPNHRSDNICQSTANPLPIYHKFIANRVPMQFQSIANLGPMEYQSSAKLTPIRVNSPLVQHQSRSIQFKSSVSPCQSSVNVLPIRVSPTPMHHKSDANPLPIFVNPSPIQCQSMINPGQPSSNPGQSSANSVQFQRQSQANQIPFQWQFLPIHLTHFQSVSNPASILKFHK